MKNLIYLMGCGGLLVFLLFTGCYKIIGEDYPIDLKASELEIQSDLLKHFPILTKKDEVVEKMEREYAIGEGEIIFTEMSKHPLHVVRNGAETTISSSVNFQLGFYRSLRKFLSLVYVDGRIEFNENDQLVGIRVSKDFSSQGDI